MIYENRFPRLAASGYHKCSPVDPTENCIAHAAGAVGEWWEPVDDQVWPDSAPRDYSVAALVAVFRGLGYETCDSDAIEPGWEKVAIYGDDHEYTHAARQDLGSGQWTSKMGREDDIRHDSLDALAGGWYGDVRQIMRRPLATGGNANETEARQSA